MGKGEILPDWKIKELIEKKVIIGADSNLVNPSSLDLRVGNKKRRLIGSFLPLEGQSIEEVLQENAILDAENIDEGTFFLEPNQPYLIDLIERLNLPDSISAKIFNKSGRGRIGISIKGLTDGTPRFDVIPRGYSGNLYAEICATAFPIVIDSGQTTIPQIRFYNGDPAPLREIDLDLLLKEYPILTDDEGNPTYSDKQREEIVRTGKFTFTTDFSEKDTLLYVANRDRRSLNLAKGDNYYSRKDFFRIIGSEDSTNSVIIHPGDFVLIKSRENLRLPFNYAAEISDYSLDFGDIRSHYAGLVNAGHGIDPEDPNTPSNIVFEIRARDIPVVLQDRQPLAKFEIHKMLDKPEQAYMAIRSTNFGKLEELLPSIFKRS